MLRGCEASLVAPLSSTAAGLYFRMWESAFPDMPPITDRTQHHEALDGSSIDALEATTRCTLAREDRIVGDVSCTPGTHGRAVASTYATAGADAARPTSPTHRHLPPGQPAAAPVSNAVPAFVEEPGLQAWKARTCELFRPGDAPGCGRES